MKTHPRFKSLMTPFAALALVAPVFGQAVFSPVPLTNSYTYEVVVPAGTAQAVPACVNFFVGSGVSLGDNTYYEQGMYTRPGHSGYNSGVPLHNTVFTNINNSAMVFLMPPDYTVNNDLAIVNSGTYGVITSGTFTFTTATNATQLAILCTGGNGGCTVNWTVNHVGGATDTGTFSVPDWFGGGPSVAWGCNGRMDQNGNYNNFNSSSQNNNVPYLYAQTISVSSATPITSIVFNYKSGGGVDNFFAVSGYNAGPNWFPIPVTGFDETAIIAAAFPLTATMDNGTNITNPGNTWYEAGYDHAATGTGLPASGSSFTSVSQPTHTYMMGNYSANCSILIDTNHQQVNVTPASPSNYTAFAFLTAGANIGGGNKMTNYCILEHADGVKETNLFYGYDWFENGVPTAIAWKANGRVSMNNRTLNNVNNNTPYLFETYFTLKPTEISSPVTNMVVKYGTAPGANSTTFIMAVSASTNALPPLITQDPTPATQEWFPSQTATFSVQVAGSQPITNQWYYSADGTTWTPLTNGVDANGSTISGANSMTLTISGLTANDAGDYTYSATNSAGGQFDSTYATLAINSGTPVAPIIDSQSPASSFSVLSNHVATVPFSVTIDASSSPPFSYQWYTGSTNAPVPVPGATSATYSVVDTNPITLFCIVTNFVGAATSSPVTLSIFSAPAPTPYEAAILAYHPLAYWPLDETSGPIAFDYASTNDGAYTGACTLGQPGVPYVGIGPSQTTVEFDGATAYVAVPLDNLDITGPLTVIQWVQPPNGGDTGFTTSLGHSDQSYRLDVANGQAHFACPGPDVVDSAMINDGNWHQLVGVYNGTTEFLYVDGVLVGSATASGGPTSPDPIRIGGAPDYGNRFFQGNIAQVAILNTALSKAQVQSLYGQIDSAPLVSISPTSPTTDVGNNITLTASLAGTPPTTLQWYVINTSSVSNNIAGATNASYTIVAPPLADSGFQYGIIAANPYGTNTASVTLTVNDVAAALAPGGDIAPTNAEVYAGLPVTYAVQASGSLPISYQWTVDGAAVNGATNASYTAPAACGTHLIQVSFTNHLSAGTPIVSSVATLQGVSAPPHLTFNTSGAGWATNTDAAGDVPSFTNNVLELTDGLIGGEASDAFYDVAQYVGSFYATFTYSGNGGADGTAFILQNSEAATNAFGEPGGALGYWSSEGVMSNSIALEFDLYTGFGLGGIAAATNGNTYADGNGAGYVAAGAIILDSGDPVNVTLNFANGILYVSLLDTLSKATFATNYVYGSPTAFLGGSDLAYVGFSGADGGITSTQTVSNFEFNPPVSLTVSSAGPNSIVLSWPVGTSAYYQLQTATSLSPANWVAGPAPTVVGAMNQVTVNTLATSHTYYRLGPPPGLGCH